MTILVDPNVLLRSAQPGHAMYTAATCAIAALMEGQRTLVISAHNVAEFWNVATRPAANSGLGMPTGEVQAEITRRERLFKVIHGTAASYAFWKKLVIEMNVQGVEVHDARLVSIMREHGIATILTFNGSDFVRYSDITGLHPATVKPELEN